MITHLRTDDGNSIAANVQVYIIFVLGISNLTLKGTMFIWTFFFKLYQNVLLQTGRSDKLFFCIFQIKIFLNDRFLVIIFSNTKLLKVALNTIKPTKTIQCSTLKAMFMNVGVDIFSNSKLQ